MGQIAVHSGDAGQVFAGCGGQGVGNCCEAHAVAADAFDICHDPVDAVAVWLETFEAQIEVDDEVNDQGGADADGEADDIDQGKSFGCP